MTVIDQETDFFTEIDLSSKPMSEKMVDIINATLTDEDVRLFTEETYDVDALYYALALVKNPGLTTEQLARPALMTTVADRRHDGLFALHYYLAHPNMTVELMDKVWNHMFSVRDKHNWVGNAARLTAFMTSPLVSEKSWKATAKLLAKNFNSVNQDRMAGLSGELDQNDPTIMLRKPPSLTGDQIAYLYRLSAPRSTEGTYKAVLLANPACPVPIRTKAIQDERSAPILIRGVVQNPGLTAEEFDIIRERMTDGTDFLEHAIKPLASNPTLPFADVLYKFVTTPGIAHHGYTTYPVIYRLIRNPALPSKVFCDHFATMSADSLETYKDLPFHDPRATEELQATLISTYRKAGKIPPTSWTEHLDAEDTRSLFLDAAPAERASMARRTDDAGILELAAHDLEYDVREAAARNDSLPQHLAVLLSQDGESPVRRATTHRKLPADCLVELATDPCYDVKMSLAQAPNLPVEVYEILAADPNYDIRRYVAQNHTVPARVHQQLLSDTRREVSGPVKSSIDFRKRQEERGK